MKNEFRNRVFLPLLLPFVVLLSMAVIILSVAGILLWNTHQGALAVAAVAAGGILLTASLASSQDKLDGSRKGVIIFAAIVPFALGGAYAGGLLGNIPDEARNINAEPLLVIGENTPVIAAENSVEFCLPGEGDACEPIDTWEVTPDTDAEGLLFVFDNRDAGVPHNVQIAELEGDGPGAEILTTETITGVDETIYSDDAAAWDELPEEWYFFCTIHPQMAGTGRVVAEG